ncbi:MAG: hypothetical protein HOQ45_02945 [Nocardioidaceae bacterium]|nr:hypothetical protein [Nocardioidaceae bacterium]
MVGYSEVQLSGPGLRSYLDALAASRPTGRTILARFSALNTDAEWFGTQTNLRKFSAFRDFLGNPAVRAALPQLLAEDPLPIGTPPPFDEVPSGVLTLDGEFAWLLIEGGAYGKFSGTHAQAKILASSAVQDLVGDRYEDYRAFWSPEPWSSFFDDVAWDVTWILVNVRLREVTIFCSMDSD